MAEEGDTLASMEEKEVEADEKDDMDRDDDVVRDDDKGDDEIEDDENAANDASKDCEGTESPAKKRKFNDISAMFKTCVKKTAEERKAEAAARESSAQEMDEKEEEEEESVDKPRTGKPSGGKIKMYKPSGAKDGIITDFFKKLPNKEDKMKQKREAAEAVEVERRKERERKKKNYVINKDTTLIGKTVDGLTKTDIPVGSLIDDDCTTKRTIQPSLDRYFNKEGQREVVPVDKADKKRDKNGKKVKRRLPKST